MSQLTWACCDTGPLSNGGEALALVHDFEQLCRVHSDTIPEHNIPKLTAAHQE